MEEPRKFRDLAKRTMGEERLEYAKGRAQRMLLEMTLQELIHLCPSLDTRNTADILEVVQRYVVTYKKQADSLMTTFFNRVKASGGSFEIKLNLSNGRELRITNLDDLRLALESVV
jgi:hypothetical protein